MVIEFLLFAFFLLVLAAAVTRYIRQTRVEACADRIIAGDQAATEKQINKCITDILTAKTWFRDITEQDRWRVEQLRDMRKEMVTPHT
ncbi:hypothetical protein ES703_44522 [subsurface metagenome]